jgi:thioredoxin 1
MSDDKKQPSKAVHLTADDFKTTLNNEGGLPVFVDFYAEWCGPCKMAAPVVDKLAGEYEGKMMITKLNVDEHNQIAAEHGVMSIPTVIIFKDGEEVDRTIGFPGEDGFIKMIDKNLED